MAFFPYVYECLQEDNTPDSPPELEHSYKTVICSSFVVTKMKVSHIWSDFLYLLESGIFPKAFWHQTSKNASLTTHFAFIVFQIMSQINTVQLKRKKEEIKREKGQKWKER